MAVELKEKDYAATINRVKPVQDSRLGTDGDPPKPMFKGLNGRYAGGGLTRREKVMYIGGGVVGTSVLFTVVLWMMSLYY
jgi:hypothetical protein